MFRRRMTISKICLTRSIISLRKVQEAQFLQKPLETGIRREIFRLELYLSQRKLKRRFLRDLIKPLCLVPWMTRRRSLFLMLWKRKGLNREIISSDREKREIICM
jgi:hypothetical protein